MRQREREDVVGNEHEVVRRERAQRVQRAVERLLVGDRLHRRVQRLHNLGHLQRQLAATQAQDACQRIHARVHRRQYALNGARVRVGGTYR